MHISNLFTQLSTDRSCEHFETLAANSSARIERIVSNGQATPDGEWYDQERDEWVVLLKGSAGLTLEGEAHEIHLLPGDYINIPRHRRHRVEWTSADETTVWLAIHM